MTLFAVNALHLYAQDEVIAVNIAISKLEVSDNQLSLRLILYNEGEKPYTVYKPHVGDICSGILKFNIIDLNTNKKHVVFPCEEIDDLGAIFINRNNSIYLGQGEGYLQDFRFNLSDISPYVKKGTYSFYVEFDLQNVLFCTDIEHILKENLVSDKYEIKF